MIHMHWLPLLSLGLSFQETMSCHVLPHFVLLKMKRQEMSVLRSIGLQLRLKLQWGWVSLSATLLGKPFYYPQKSLNSLTQHGSSVSLVHVGTKTSYSCCRCVSFTFLLQHPCFTTSRRCSNGLRSGDHGGHWTSINSFIIIEPPMLWLGLIYSWNKTDIRKQTVAIRRCL